MPEKTLWLHFFSTQGFPEAILSPNSITQNINVKILSLLRTMNFLDSVFCCCTQTDHSPDLLPVSSSTIKIHVIDQFPPSIRPSPSSQLLKQCRNKGHVFVDDSFPPTAASLKDFQHHCRKIIWKRIPDLVPSCKIFDPSCDPAESIAASACKQAYIVAGLLALSLTPGKIQSIFAGECETNKEGGYSLVMRIGGVLQQVVVDDCVPVFQDTGRPLVCGDVNGQVWMMLVCKAWAKVCGSYGELEKAECFDFISAFSPAPCFSFLLQPQMHDALIKEVMLSLKTPHYSACVSTSEKPGPGLAALQNYAVRGVGGGVELGETRGGAQNWVGVGMEELLQSCYEMIVSKWEKKMVSDQPTIYMVEHGKPLFLEMRLQQDFSMVLSVVRQRKEKGLMRVVVGKKRAEGGYTYVASQLQDYYKQLSVQCRNIVQGQYAVMILITGPDSKASEISLTCYRRLSGQMTLPHIRQIQQSLQSYIYFLKTLLLDYAHKSKGVTQRELPESHTSLMMQQLYLEGGLGYLIIKTAQQTKTQLKYLRISFNHSLIEASEYRLLQYRGQSELLLQPGKQQTLVFMLRGGHERETSQIGFPIGVFLSQIF